MVYSATRGPTARRTTSSFLKQQLDVPADRSAWCMAATAAIDYRKLRDFAPVALRRLRAACCSLVLVAGLGSQPKGTQGWFQLGPFQLQPSELAKLALIIGLAALAVAVPRATSTAGASPCCWRRRACRWGSSCSSPTSAPPWCSVAITLAICSWSAACRRATSARSSSSACSAPAVVLSSRHARGVPARPAHHVRRPGRACQQTSTQDDALQPRPVEDRHRRGGIVGQGLFKGRQTRLGNVPEQHTDFIFTAVGEELGFVGVGTPARPASASSSGGSGAPRSSPATSFGTLLCVGVMAMLVFQVFENVGMTMGIMPITGIPLPVRLLRRLVDPRRRSRPSAWCSTSTCAGSR